MTTDQLTGRALDEAAARAMGWTTNKWEAWYGADGYWRGQADGPKPTEREMMAWLHGRRDCIILGCYRDHVTACAASVVAENVHARGTDLREALERLVVAVKQREEAK